MWICSCLFLKEIIPILRPKRALSVPSAKQQNQGPNDCLCQTCKCWSEQIAKKNQCAKDPRVETTLVAELTPLLSLGAEKYMENLHGSEAQQNLKNSKEKKFRCWYGSLKLVDLNVHCKLYSLSLTKLHGTASLFSVVLLSAYVVQAVFLYILSSLSWRCLILGKLSCCSACLSFSSCPANCCYTVLMG